MEYVIEFDPEGRYATIRGWGLASLEKMRNTSVDLVSHPAWKRDMHLMFDMREVDTRELSATDVQVLVQTTVSFNEQMGSGRGAIVVSEDLSFGLARMWTAYSENRVTTNNRIFRSMDEAMKWMLGPDEEA